MRKEAVMCPWKNWKEFAAKIGRLTFDFSLVPDRTALIPVDLQYFCASPDHGFGLYYKTHTTPDIWGYFSTNLTKRVIPNNQRLLSFFRERKLCIIHVQRGFVLPNGADEAPSMLRKLKEIDAETGRKPAWYPVGSFEHQAIPPLAALSGELVVTKTSYSPFATTGLDALLRHLAIETLIVTGVDTNVCVESTARAAFDLGYNVALVDDACGGKAPLLHDVTMIVFATRFGRVMTTEEVLTELTSNLQKSTGEVPEEKEFT